MQYRSKMQFIIGLLFVRIHMPMLIEILPHRLVILRTRLTEPIPLDRMRERAVLVQTAMTRVPFGRVRPGHDAIVVATREALAVADGGVAVVGRHGRVVAVAEDVFAQEIQAVLGVVGVEGGGAGALEVDEVAADVFLKARIVSSLPVSVWVDG